MWSFCILTLYCPADLPALLARPRQLARDPGDRRDLRHCPALPFLRLLALSLPLASSHLLGTVFHLLYLVDQHFFSVIY